MINKMTRDIFNRLNKEYDELRFIGEMDGELDPENQFRLEEINKTLSKCVIEEEYFDGTCSICGKKHIKTIHSFWDLYVCDNDECYDALEDDVMRALTGI